MQRGICVSCFGNRVRSQDGAGQVVELAFREPVNQLRQRFEDEGRIELHADHACRRRQHLGHRQQKPFRQSAAAVDGDAVAGPRGAVGVTGIDQNRAGHSARDPQVAAGELHGRGLHAILGEHRGSVGRKAADDQREIVFVRLPDAGVNSGIGKTQRQIHFGVSPRSSFSPTPVRRKKPR